MMMNRLVMQQAIKKWVLLEESESEDYSLLASALFTSLQKRPPPQDHLPPNLLTCMCSSFISSWLIVHDILNSFIVLPRIGVALVPLLIQAIDQIPSFEQWEQDEGNDDDNDDDNDAIHKEEKEKKTISIHSLPFYLLAHIPPSIIQTSSISSITSTSVDTSLPLSSNLSSPLQKALHSFHSSFPSITCYLIKKIMLAIHTKHSSLLSILVQGLFSTPLSFVEPLLSLLLLTLEEIVHHHHHHRHHHIIIMNAFFQQESVYNNSNNNNNNKIDDDDDYRLEQSLCMIVCEVALHRRTDLTNADVHSFTDSIYRLFHAYCSHIPSFPSSSSIQPKLVVEVDEVAKENEENEESTYPQAREMAVMILRGLDVALLQSLPLCKNAASRKTLLSPTSAVSRLVSAIQHAMTDEHARTVELPLFLYYLRYLTEKMEMEWGQYLFGRLVDGLVTLAADHSLSFILRQNLEKVCFQKNNPTLDYFRVRWRFTL